MAGKQTGEGRQGVALVRVVEKGNLSALGAAPLAFRTFNARELLETWLAGKDAKTVRAYRGDLEAFAHWAGADSLESALEAFLVLPAPAANGAGLRYRGALLEQGLAAATVNRRLAALRSAVSLARLLGRVTWALEVPGVESQPYRDTRGPGAGGFRSMLHSLEARQDAKGARDRALLRLMFDMALRRGEVVALDVEHFDRRAGTLSVLGKKRRERVALTLPAPTAAALEAWLQVRGMAAGPLFVALDPSGVGTRLTGRSVARIVVAAGDRVGLEHVRPHGLRHAAITHMLEVTGGNVSRVQRFSRHRDVRTVETYNDNRADTFGELAALAAAVA